MPPGKILAPVDFSAGSTVAVEYALFLARALGSSVTLLHVYDNPRLLGRIVPGADVDSDELNAREAAVDKLNDLRAVLRSSRMAFLDIAVERGDAAHAILEHARAGQFDLIVMGTHGRRGLERAVMGSVAESVIRHSTIPVVTVHLPR